MHAEPSWSLPPVHSPVIAELGFTDAERRAWTELVASWTGPDGHQLLGYDHGHDAYLHSALDTDEILRTAYFERYQRDPRGTTLAPFADPDLAARASAFRLLLALADDPELGVGWGDGAPTRFLVHRDRWGAFEVASPTSLAAVLCDRS